MTPRAAAQYVVGVLFERAEHLAGSPARSARYRRQFLESFDKEVIAAKNLLVHSAVLRIGAKR